MASFFLNLAFSESEGHHPESTLIFTLLLAFHGGLIVDWVESPVFAEHEGPQAITLVWSHHLPAVCKYSGHFMYLWRKAQSMD